MVLRNTLVILTMLVLLSTSLFSRNFTMGGDTTTSSVHYSLDACDAFVNAGTLADYSEFVGVTNNDPSCTSIFPSGTIYRTNPSVNTHSCTPGVNGSNAMCVSSDEGCTYDPNSDKAIKIELMVSPGPSGTGSLSTLSFYEQAPETYNWNFGPSGINNYPTQYAVRVLKDGVEIFRQDGNATTTDWTLETFDFSNNPDFTVTGNTFFTIELLGYCVIGNGAPVTAWDIDEVTITSECQASNVLGGSINIVGGGTTIDICANDGVSDAFDVVLSGNTGSDATYVITDENGIFLAVGGGPTFDLEGAGSGVCFIWNVSSTGPLTGVAVGEDVNNVTGCFALSNPIVVNRNMQGGGTLSTTDGFTQVSICVGDGVADPINVNLTGNTASNMAWVITDAATGEILGLPAGPPFDLEGAGLGTCNIYNVSYEGTLDGLVMGGSISDISGCFGLSNPITVERTTATAGAISSNGLTTFNICTSDGVPDILNIDISGNVGTDESFIVTDVNGNILRVISVASGLDVDGFGIGTCLLYHVSYDGSINGLGQGGNISNLNGCFGLSNAITINKQATTGGVFSTNNFTFVSICENQGTSNIIETTLNNNMGANVEYFIADTDGNITQFISGPPFDFSSFDRGRYALYAFSYDGASSGLTIGQNVDSLVGSCNGLSNPIVVSKGSATGGTITSPLGNNFNVCVQGNVTSGIDFNLTGADGTTSRWIITDLNGNIIGLPGPPPINIELAGNAQSCIVYHLSYDTFFTGLGLGSNISGFDGCFDLSNGITINKSVTNGGVLSAPGNTSTVNLCNMGGGSTVSLNLNNTVGDNSAWIITDQNNNIVSTPAGPPFDFASLGNGTFRVYNVSYNGNISGITVGSSANNISGDCFDLSNFVSVNNNTVAPGTITSPLGDNFSICVGNGVSDPIDFSVTGNSGSNGRWVVTDANGMIIDLPGSPPFNLAGTSSTCLVWYLSTSGNVGGISIGANASGLTGCFALSNPITVSKNDVNGGVLATDNNTTSTTVCVGDGNPDFVNVVLNGATGTNNQWVITDANGNILGLPAAPPFEFDGAGLGVCSIWNLSYEGTLSGAAVGSNVNGVSADCFSLSNAIVVNRIQPDAGTISTNGSTTVEVCLDDPNDTVPVTVNGGSSNGTKGWIITDANGAILGLPAGPPFSFTGAGTGACNVYRICSNGMVSGMTVGSNISALSGCFDLSNAITVTRIEAGPGSSSTSKLTFDMEACYSDQTDNSSKDYSEFTANVMNDASCTQFAVLGGGFVYRRDPDNNMHSCTDGANGGVAMCVSSLDDCTFVDDSDLAVRFEIEVTPGTSGTGSISGLSFYEAAPTMFQWINGATGINNYPTSYGIRVLRDGVEVFKQIDLNTTNDWTLESFDFSNNTDFTVSQTSVFTFELLGYCTVGNGAAVNAWDIDEIMVSSNCSSAGSCDTTLTEEEEEEEEVVVEEEEENISFNVRPNPADNMLILEANKVPMDGSMIYIYDRMGRMVESYSIGDKTLQVSLANYTAGFYYIRMISEGKQTTRKFLKQTK